MLGNHEKMVLISSTTNEWPQMDDQQRHQKGHLNNNTTMTASSSPAAASSGMMMEKPPPGQDQLLLQQQQQQLLNQQALKCPRCDSSNTKFCYYNNYSLSQPRHFCKACKRYWTRGGTLRNVPVGGGCRKNKRIKRPGTTSSSSSAAAAADGTGPSSSSTSSVPTGTNNSSNPNILSSSQQSDHRMNPIFYGLPNNPFMDGTSTNNNSTPASGFDFHQLAGLGFDNYRNRFSNSSLPCSNFNPIFSTSQSAPTTMASVLASKFINGGGFGSKDAQARGGGPAHQYFQTLLPFEDLQIAAGNHADGNGGTGAKDVKVEDHNHHHHHHHHHQGGQNRLEWSTNINHSNNIHVNNVHEQMGMGMSDPTSLYWSSTNLGSNWHDPANNLGSSVSSLI